jgi:hypothetical protein
LPGSFPALDSDGNLYLAAGTTADDLVTFNAIQPAHGGGLRRFPVKDALQPDYRGYTDCFVMKIAPR